MKLINEKAKKIIIKILSVLTTLILINIPLLIFILTSTILALLYYDGLKIFKERSIISGILISLIPAILFIIFRILLFKKNKKVKVTVHILGLLFIPIAVILYAYLIVGIFILGIFADVVSEYPSISEYSTKIKNLSKYEYTIRHFPGEIPENAQNYYFYVDGGGMHGYAISYLQFNTDNEYLDNVIKQNKDNIYKKLPYEEVSKYYKDFGCIGKVSVNAADKYDVYILKNNNGDDWYTSGFIISKELHDIIYFYANYNLEINRKEKDNVQNSV